MIFSDSLYNKCDFYKEYSKIDVIFEIYDISDSRAAEWYFTWFEAFAYENHYPILILILLHWIPVGLKVYLSAISII